jgi:hypothetical protein
MVIKIDSYFAGRSEVHKFSGIGERLTLVVRDNSVT